MKFTVLTVASVPIVCILYSIINFRLDTVIVEITKDLVGIRL